MTTTQTTPITVECDECLQQISEDVRLRWWNGETFSRSLCRADAQRLVDTDQAEIIGWEPYHFRTTR
ncbi:MAG: hypothetical protein F4Y01_05075 [Gammaproteobacteria bacterium]|nr:hypothetical protein [Gammaproteobacteria bacterium]